MSHLDGNGHSTLCKQRHNRFSWCQLVANSIISFSAKIKSFADCTSVTALTNVTGQWHADHWQTIVNFIFLRNSFQARNIMARVRIQTIDCVVPGPTADGCLIAGNLCESLVWCFFNYKNLWHVPNGMRSCAHGDDTTMTIRGKYAPWSTHTIPAILLVSLSPLSLSRTVNTIPFGSHWFRMEFLTFFFIFVSTTASPVRPMEISHSTVCNWKQNSKRNANEEVEEEMEKN